MKWLRFLLFLTICPIARAEPSGEETKAFQSARQAYQDGLFDVSDQRFLAFLKKYPNSEFKWKARLIEAQSLYYLGAFEEAAALLDGPAAQFGNEEKPDSLFWRAEIATALNHWPQAVAGYREFLAAFPQNPQVPEAKLNLAWALFKQNDVKEATALLTELSAQDANGDAGQSAALLLAKMAIAENKTADAVKQLDALLARKPRPKIAYEATYLSAELDLAAQPQQAASKYLRITSDSRAFPKPLVAESWFGLGRAYRASNDPKKALDAFQEAYTLADSEQLKLAAFKLYLETARDAKTLPEAITALQEFARKNQDKPNAGSALFAIGLALAENNESGKAIAFLESLLVAYPKTRWRAPAYYQLSKLYEHENKPDNAVKALQSCLETSDDPGMTRMAQFELGKILLEKADYPGAIAQFEKVTGPQDTLAEDAGFNLLLAEARTQKPEPFVKSEEKFLAAFPQGRYREQVALAKGEMYEQLSQTDPAVAAYRQALELAADPAQKAVILMRLGDLLHRTGDLEKASDSYEQIVSQYPKDVLVPEAACKAVLDELSTKKINGDKAIEALLALWKKYPKSPQSPEILFHAAELYFKAQDFVNAQNYFEKLGAEFPQSELAQEANYWAGNAAAAHGDLAGAVTILEKLPETSPLKPDARLLQGRIYHRQLRFANAITLFDSVATSEKTGPRFVEATLRKGDCFFALGDKDSSNYEQAAAAFGIIINGNQGNIAERNEAGFKRAKSLEKLNRTSDALALYLDVLYGRLQPPADKAAAAAAAAGTPVAQLQNPPELIWQIKAGLEAARMKELAGDWRGAIEIYRRLEQLGGPNQQEFHDMINKIRRDNYIYD